MTATDAVPEPPPYSYFAELLHRITSVPGFESAAGSPSEDWLPNGPGYVIACQLIAGAAQWYGGPIPGVGNDDLHYLLVESEDGEIAFSLHPERENAAEWATDAVCTIECATCQESERRILELIDLRNGTSYRPQLNVGYSWVQSICVLDGSEADPTDHSAHSHREVVHP